MGTTFAESMKETLGLAVAKIGYKFTSSLISKDSYCVFVKRYNEKIGLYIKCTDNRAKGGDVVVALWIAPVEFPDDRLEVLSLGFKIVVYSEYEISDEIVRSIGNKIIELSGSISSLAAAVEKDMASPFIAKGRQKYYYYSRRMYDLLCTEEELSQPLEELKSSARKCVDAKLPLNKLVAQCTAVINKWEDIYFSDLMPQLENEEKGRLLASVLYAETLM